MTNDSEKLWNCLCCAGEDHTIREGGRNINLVVLKKLAKWPYLAAMNFLVRESKDHPLASAVVCDSCLKAGKEMKYAMAGVDDNGEAKYYRVPLEELEDPEFYSPEHHPDVKAQRN